MAFQTRALKDYNKSSLHQLKIALSSAPIVSKYLNLAHSLNPQVLNIADYGSSEGYNSMFLFQKVLQGFRSSHPTPVSIVHTDLPANNWTVLFNTINTSPDSYRHIPNVFHSAIGHSYYNQLFPSNSIHFGFSSFAFHYLSKVPSRTGEPRVFYPEASAQMMEDLANNLNLRMKELTVGGYLVFTFAGRAENEQMLIEKRLLVLAKRLIEKGIISKEEYLRLYSPLCPLTAQEMEDSLKNLHGLGKVIELKTLKTVSFLYEEYQKHKNFEEYVQNYVEMVWPMLQNPYYIALCERSEEEKIRILDEIKKEFYQLIDNEIFYEIFHVGVIQKV